MNDDTLLDTLVAAYRAGQPLPAALEGTIPMERAYALQVRLLDRLRRAGAAHTGWKIGQTNQAMRAERGETLLALGYLLADTAHEDGATITLRGGGQWFMEPELAFVLARDLPGPDVDEASVAAAVGSLHPAFELVSVPAEWTDRAAQRAVNSNQAGYVLGPALSLAPDPQALADLPVQVVCNGETLAEVRCADVIDPPLTSTAWLANHLSSLGEHLCAGQVVLTGSFTPLLPMAPGEAWSARIGEGAIAMVTA